METTTQTASRTRGKGLLITVSVVIAIFALCEGYQRISDYLRWRKNTNTPYSVRFETANGYPVTDKGGYVVLVHHPHLLYRFKEDQEQPYVTINSQGFRGKDWVMEGQSSCRIIVLGGSTVFGQGASGDDKVFVSVLEWLLNESLTSMPWGVEVLNAGVTGYDSAQELVLLTTRLLDYRPDVALIFDGWNDLYFAGIRPQGVQDPVSPTFDELDAVLSKHTQRWANILRLSAFVRMLEQQVPWGRSEEGQARRFGNYSDNLGVYLPQYRRNLERMVRLARSYRVEGVVASQPELFHRTGEIPDAEQEVRREWQKERYKGYVDFVRTQYPAFIQASRTVARAEGVLYVDATTAFDEFDGVAFVDAAHLTDQGNEMLARFLLPTVSRALTQKASRSGCNATTERS